MNLCILNKEILCPSCCKLMELNITKLVATARCCNINFISYLYGFPIKLKEEYSIIEINIDDNLKFRWNTFEKRFGLFKKDINNSTSTYLYRRVNNFLYFKPNLDNYAKLINKLKIYLVLL